MIYVIKIRLDVENSKSQESMANGENTLLEGSSFKIGLVRL